MQVVTQLKQAEAQGVLAMDWERAYKKLKYELRVGHTPYMLVASLISLGSLKRGSLQDAMVALQTNTPRGDLAQIDEATLQKMGCMIAAADKAMQFYRHQIFIGDPHQKNEISFWARRLQRFILAELSLLGTQHVLPDELDLARRASRLLALEVYVEIEEQTSVKAYATYLENYNRHDFKAHTEHLKAFTVLPELMRYLGLDIGYHLEQIAFCFVEPELFLHHRRAVLAHVAGIEVPGAGRDLWLNLQEPWKNFEDKLRRQQDRVKRMLRHKGLTDLHLSGRIKSAHRSWVKLRELCNKEHISVGGDPKAYWDYLYLIKDLVGFQVITQNRRQIRAVSAALRQEYFVLNTADYIRHGPELNKHNGYRAIHIKCLPAERSETYTDFLKALDAMADHLKDGQHWLERRVYVEAVEVRAMADGFLVSDHDWRNYRATMKAHNALLIKVQGLRRLFEAAHLSELLQAGKFQKCVTVLEKFWRIEVAPTEIQLVSNSDYQNNFYGTAAHINYTVMGRDAVDTGISIDEFPSPESFGRWFLTQVRQTMDVQIRLPDGTLDFLNLPVRSQWIDVLMHYQAQTNSEGGMRNAEQAPLKVDASGIYLQWQAQGASVSDYSALPVDEGSFIGFHVAQTASKARIQVQPSQVQAWIRGTSKLLVLEHLMAKNPEWFGVDVLEELRSILYGRVDKTTCPVLTRLEQHLHAYLVDRGWNVAIEDLEKYFEGWVYRLGFRNFFEFLLGFGFLVFVEDHTDERSSTLHGEILQAIESIALHRPRVELKDQQLVIEAAQVDPDMVFGLLDYLAQLHLNIETLEFAFEKQKKSWPLTFKADISHLSEDVGIDLKKSIAQFVARYSQQNSLDADAWYLRSDMREGFKVNKALPDQPGELRRLMATLRGQYSPPDRADALRVFGIEAHNGRVQVELIQKKDQASS